MKKIRLRIGYKENINYKSFSKHQLCWSFTTTADIKGKPGWKVGGMAHLYYWSHFTLLYKLLLHERGFLWTSISLNTPFPSGAWAQEAFCDWVSKDPSGSATVLLGSKLKRSLLSQGWYFNVNFVVLLNTHCHLCSAYKGSKLLALTQHTFLPESVLPISVFLATKVVPLSCLLHSCYQALPYFMLVVCMVQGWYSHYVIIYSFKKQTAPLNTVT